MDLYPIAKRMTWKHTAAFFCAAVLFLYAYLSSAPRDFPAKTIITVREGAGLLEVSNTLAEEHVIRSPWLFRSAAILFGGEHELQAGDYYLSYAESPFELARRIVRGTYGIETVKITIPEGFTDEKISSLFGPEFSRFDHDAFVRLAPQGYLFPDTYFIGVNATATSTLGLLQDNYHKKVDPLADEVKASGHSIYNIIDVASILEAEAKTPADMALISGIIWKRLSLGMPLQVDAAPDTYKNKGLPPSPINNPGLHAIKAAIHPTASSYLYYISDKEGLIHYAKTLDEQDANIKKYLQ